MNQVVPIVHQDPIRIGVALHAGWPFAQFFQLDLDFIADGLDLPAVGTGRDNEEVSEGGNLAQVQNTDIKGLFALRGFYRGAPDWGLSGFRGLRNGSWGNLLFGSGQVWLLVVIVL